MSKAVKANICESINPHNPPPPLAVIMSGTITLHHNQTRLHEPPQLICLSRYTLNVQDMFHNHVERPHLSQSLAFPFHSSPLKVSFTVMYPNPTNEIIYSQKIKTQCSLCFRLSGVRDMP